MFFTHVNFSGLVPIGSQLILTCSYSVAPGEYIDSIKWYLNTSEIYRIVPGLNRDRLVKLMLGSKRVLKILTFLYIENNHLCV